MTTMIDIRRVGATVGLAAVSALILAGCAGSSVPDVEESQGPVAGTPSAVSEDDWDDIVETATAEGEVAVYTSLASSEVIWEAFQKAYPGIRLVIERAPSGDLMTKIGQEQQVGAGRADVVLHEQLPWFRELSANDTFAPVQLSPQAQTDGWSDLMGEENFPTLFAYPLSIAWNTETAEAVSSIDELIEEHPDAKVGVFDPAITPALAYQYELWSELYGDDLTERLSEMDTTVFGSATPMSQSMAAGEIDYALPMTPVLGPLLAENAPVDSALPESDVLALPNAIAVLGDAPHPNASQVFMNWLMSEDGQMALINKFAPGTPHLDIDGEIGWDEVTLFDPEVWTNDDAEEWIQEEWVGRF